MSFSLSLVLIREHQVKGPMAEHFSANQYNDAFKARRLQQYTIPHPHKEFPKRREGETIIRANDRGHLLQGVPRSNESPWGTHFVGTWDMPKTIPSNHAENKCARTNAAYEKLMQEKYDNDGRISGSVQPKKRTRVPPAKPMVLYDMVPCECPGTVPGKPVRRILSPSSPEPRLHPVSRAESEDNRNNFDREPINELPSTETVDFQEKYE